MAISDRNQRKAERIFREAGLQSVELVNTGSRLEKEIDRDRYCYTKDPLLLCQSKGIDAVVEATGDMEFGCLVVKKAIENEKHVVHSNMGIDSTVGPILKVYADRAGVVNTMIDGDEPYVAMKLVRLVRNMGFTPVLAGNMKGYYDPYRTPHTQRKFATKHNLKPEMATSFIDGTKLSMEMAVLANATGFRVAKRGMFGHRCEHVNDVLKLFPLKRCLRGGGNVDYILGAKPGSGVFVVGYNDHPVKKQYLRYLKMGEGPFYLFHIPFHLPGFGTPITVAKAVVFGAATITPRGGPVCDVVAVAKKDLKRGEILDGSGGFTCYGLIENADVSREENLLPISLSTGCRLKHGIPMGQAISCADVEVPPDRLCDELRAEQDAHFNLRK